MEIRSNAFITILILILGVLLQMKLSKSERKIPGLILPSVSFLFTLLGAIGFVSFSTVTSSMEVNGNIVSQTTQSGNMLGTIFGFVLILLYLNIPTFILFAIYFSQRKKLRRNKEVDKMRIEDL